MSDWIEWKGGKCPVEYFVNVEIKQRRGNISFENKAYVFDWQHRLNSSELDIIAYRIIEDGK